MVPCARLLRIWHSFFGNVLRTPGHMRGWTDHGVNFTHSTAVFPFGYTDDRRYPKTAHDSIADFTFSAPPGTTTAHRIYDFFNNTVSWDQNNSHHDLPKSLYLTHEPAFLSQGVDTHGHG
jgi:hypothetical protein